MHLLGGMNSRLSPRLTSPDSLCALCDDGLDHSSGYLWSALHGARCPILDSKSIQSVPMPFPRFFFNSQNYGI